MSADNWANCPRCQKALDGTVDTLARRMADEYGKIPVADYTDPPHRITDYGD